MAKFRRLANDPQAIKVFEDGLRQGLTDKQIQNALLDACHYRWNIDTIAKRRRGLGIIKKTGEPANIELSDAPMLGSPRPGMDEFEKAQWFRAQFKKTHLYQTIRQQFESHEVDVYIEDYGNLCYQFEDIVLSEFFQIDDFLKHRILVDRQLILVKSLQQQIADSQEWFRQNPKKEDEDKDFIKYRIMQQRQLEDRYRYLKSANDRYDALVKERQKTYSSLAATRKDRLDELRGGKETFFALVSSLQHSQDERNRQGRYAQLTKLAANDVRNIFRTPQEFPDGTVAPIIMDEKTNFGEEN